jgi:hypothetical protein
MEFSSTDYSWPSMKSIFLLIWTTYAGGSFSWWSGSSTILICNYVNSVYTYTVGVHLFFNGRFYQSWKLGIDQVPWLYLKMCSVRWFKPSRSWYTFKKEHPKTHRFALTYNIPNIILGQTDVSLNNQSNPETVSGWTTLDYVWYERMIKAKRAWQGCFSTTPSRKS